MKAEAPFWLPWLPLPLAGEGWGEGASGSLSRSLPARQPQLRKFAAEHNGPAAGDTTQNCNCNPTTNLSLSVELTPGLLTLVLVKVALTWALYPSMT